LKIKTSGVSGSLIPGIVTVRSRKIDVDPGAEKVSGTNGTAAYTA
jgi:hypothetical protein